MTFTKEQAELHAFITGFLSDPMHDDKSAKSMTTKVFRMALAALTAEPVAYMYRDGDDVEYNGHNEFSDGGRGMPLYAAPPVTIVPEEIKRRIGGLDWGWEGEFNRGWNACRAAMLQGDK